MTEIVQWTQHTNIGHKLGLQTTFLVSFIFDFNKNS